MRRDVRKFLLARLYRRVARRIVPMIQTGDRAALHSYCARIRATLDRRAAAAGLAMIDSGAIEEFPLRDGDSGSIDYPPEETRWLRFGVGHHYVAPNPEPPAPSGIKSSAGESGFARSLGVPVTSLVQPAVVESATVPHSPHSRATPAPVCWMSFGPTTCERHEQRGCPKVSSS